MKLNITIQLKLTNHIKHETEKTININIEININVTIKKSS